MPEENQERRVSGNIYRPAEQRGTGQRTEPHKDEKEKRDLSSKASSRFSFSKGSSQTRRVQRRVSRNQTVNAALVVCFSKQMPVVESHALTRDQAVIRRAKGEATEANHINRQQVR